MEGRNGGGGMNRVAGFRTVALRFRLVRIRIIQAEAEVVPSSSSVKVKFS